MSEHKSNDNRRKLLKSIAVGSSAVVAGQSLPQSWTKPVVDSVMLPAHAETTDDSGTLPPEVCTDLLRLEIQDGYNASGTGPVLNDSDKPLNIGILGGCESSTRYITAWGYYKDAPNTPVYLNTKVLWTTEDSSIAFIGTGPGVLPQDNSFVTGVKDGETIMNATISDLCGGIVGLPANAITAAVKVIVKDIC